MPLHLISVTPLARRWSHPFAELTRGIRIIERPIFNELVRDFWNLRRTEVTALKERNHWVCIDRQKANGPPSSCFSVRLIYTLPPRNARVSVMGPNRLGRLDSDCK